MVYKYKLTCEKWCRNAGPRSARDRGQREAQARAARRAGEEGGVEGMRQEARLLQHREHRVEVKLACYDDDPGIAWEGTLPPSALREGP